MSNDIRARLERVQLLAADVLGGVEAGEAWLGTPHPALGERTPIDVARTAAGAASVSALLAGLGERLAA